MPDPVLPTAIQITVYKDGAIAQAKYDAIKAGGKAALVGPKDVVIINDGTSKPDSPVSVKTFQKEGGPYWVLTIWT